MKNLQTYVKQYKKLFCIIGFIFIICLEGCVFPVGNFAYGGDAAIALINLASAIGIGKCVGEIETMLFPKATWLFVLLVNSGITVLGLVARYFLEYGEVSNTYNFTLKNVVVHTMIMMLLSMMFWMQTKTKGESSDEKK